MKKLPACIMADGETGVPDNAAGLEDSGKSSEGHGACDRKQALRGRKGMAETADAGGDFRASG